MKQTETNQQLMLYREVCNTLLSLGVPAHVRGYRYLISAITLVVEDPTYLNKITGRLYPEVAAENDIKPQCVERSIRNAIEMTFNKGDTKALQSYFGTAVDPNSGKLTNSSFIATTALKIRLELGIADTAKKSRI